MRVEPARATIAIAGVTAAVSAGVVLAGLAFAVAPLAGFVPARIGDAAWAGAALPVWLTPFSAPLIDYSLFSLLFNVLILVYCGRQTEQVTGARGMVALYVAGALAAALGYFVQAHDTVYPLVGATGPVSAVLGAYSIYYGRRRTAGWRTVPGWVIHSLQLAAGWTAIQLLIWIAGMNGPVPSPIGAAIGGFLAGLALAQPLLLWRYRRA